MVVILARRSRRGSSGGPMRRAVDATRKTQETALTQDIVGRDWTRDSPWRERGRLLFVRSRNVRNVRRRRDVSPPDNARNPDRRRAARRLRHAIAPGGEVSAPEARLRAQHLSHRPAPGAGLGRAGQGRGHLPHRRHRQDLLQPPARRGLPHGRRHHLPPAGQTLASQGRGARLSRPGGASPDAAGEGRRATGRRSDDAAASLARGIGGTGGAAHGPGRAAARGYPGAQPPRTPGTPAPRPPATPARPAAEPSRAGEKCLRFWAISARMVDFV